MANTVAIGIDIGGTKTAFGIVDRMGNIICQDKIPTTGHATIQDYIAAIQEALNPFIQQVGRDNIAGIGIGAPNASFLTGEIVHAANLPWSGVIPFASMLSDAMGFKAAITNDANAATIGEMTYGEAKGMKDFILVTLGTGLGSGFVANGQLIYGSDGFAGELGHVIAVRDGRQCGCGRRGCLETYASATGIARSAELWLDERNDATLLRKEKGRITAEMIYNAAKQGDAFALELFEYTGKILGQSLADAVAITSPEAIIFFGGLANARELLIDSVKKHMEANLLRVYKNKVVLKYSALHHANAAILGASALAWQ